MAKNEKRNPFAGEMLTETVRGEDWPDGFEVVVQEISWTKQQKINQMGMPEGVRLPEDRHDKARFMAEFTTDRMNTPGYRLEILKAGVQSWTFVDGAGNPVPLTNGAFEKLPGSWGDLIMDAIERLNPDRDEDFLDRNGSDDEPGADAR
jgi:hypothetical protein